MQIVYCVSCSETSAGLQWINSLIFIAWSFFSLFYLEKKEREITWLHGAELYTECAFSIIFVTNINKNQPCTARRSISCLPGGSEPVLLCIARLCICNVISRGAVSPVAWTSYPAVSNSASSILAIVARFRSHLKNKIKKNTLTIRLRLAGQCLCISWISSLECTQDYINYQWNMNMG